MSYKGKEPNAEAADRKATELRVGYRGGQGSLLKSSACEVPMWRESRGRQQVEGRRGTQGQAYTVCGPQKEQCITVSLRCWEVLSTKLVFSKCSCDTFSWLQDGKEIEGEQAYAGDGSGSWSCGLGRAGGEGRWYLGLKAVQQRNRYERRDNTRGKTWQQIHWVGGRCQAWLASLSDGRYHSWKQNTKRDFMNNFILY